MDLNSTISTRMTELFPFLPETLTPSTCLRELISSKTHLEEVRQFLELAGNLGDRLGVNVYVVGGFVRDLILGKDNDDIDLVIEGDGNQYADQLAQELGVEKPTHHQKFRTAVLTLKNGWKIDVCSSRLEHYPHPASLPIIELSSLQMDLFRRDFTINALAMQVNNHTFGQVRDYFRGVTDLASGRVAVLHPCSFIDDPTRIFRAVRFEQRYGFLIDEQTQTFVQKAVRTKVIDHLTGTRVFHEIIKIFEDRHPVRCFQRLHELEVLTELSPQLVNFQHQVFQEAVCIKTQYDLLNCKKQITLWKFYLLAVTHCMKPDALDGFLSRLLIIGGTAEELKKCKVSYKGVIKQIKSENWFTSLKTGEICHRLKEVPVEAILMIMTLRSHEVERKFFSSYLTTYKDTGPDISGKDLVQAGMKAGPKFKIILEEVLRAKLNGDANNKEEQLVLAKKLYFEAV